MSLWRRVPARRSRGRRLCLGIVFRFRFLCGLLMARCRGADRRVVCLNHVLCRLFFFFLLLWWFFDAAQLAQDFLALLRRLPSPGELSGKILFTYLVEFRSPVHALFLTLVPHLRQAVANRPPL